MTELEQLLAADPQAARCLRCLTGGEPMTLAGIAACYGDEPETPEQELARIVGVTDEQARRALNQPSPVTAGPADDVERVWQAWAERIGVAEPAADDGDAELERLLW